MPVVVAASTDSNLVAENHIDEPMPVGDPPKSASSQVILQGFGASAEATVNDQANPRKEWAEANLSPMRRNSTRGLWGGSGSNRHVKLSQVLPESWTCRG
jgi:hypothetical protein